MRITDRSNGESLGDSATVQDAELRVRFACGATGLDTIGSSCELSTSADSIVPGYAIEGRRAVVGLGAVEVEDDAGASFLRQGVFVP